MRAAFYALIESHGSDPQQVQNLHDLAIHGRAPDEEAPLKRRKLRGKKRKGSGPAAATAPEVPPAGPPVF